MAEMTRFGALVSLAPDRRPIGRSEMVLAAVDDDGVVTAEWTETIEPGPQFYVVRFVEFDDGTRVADADAAPGHSQLGTRAGITRAELEEAVREMVFEDDVRHIAEHDPEVAEMYEARFDWILDALARRGVEADAAALEALPFVVELEPEAEAAVAG